MADKVRIGHVTSNLYGAGGGNRILSFARGCDRKRFELLMIVVSRGDLEQPETYGSTRKRFVDAGIEVVCLDAPVWSEKISRLRPAAVLQACGRFTRLTARLTELVRKRRLDVLDINGEAPLALGVCAAKLTRVPTVATVFDNLFWDRPVWRPLGRYLLSQTDVMVADSEQRSSMIHRWLPARCLRPRVVRNGIEVPLSRWNRAEMRAKLGLPSGSDVKVVAQISRFMASKGQLVLIEAMRQVLDRIPNAFLLLCGYPAPRDPTDFVAELWHKAQQCGVDHRLRILSYPEDIADVWATIDVHAHPSLRDSSPIAVIEGMALGKPAVVSAEGGIVELVSHDQSGLVVPKGNARALADAIIQLLDDPRRAARLGKAARERYLAHHRQEQMVEQFEHLFSALAQARRRVKPEACQNHV